MDLISRALVGELDLIIQAIYSEAWEAGYRRGRDDAELDYALAE